MGISSGGSALLSFTAENVRCYRDEVYLSMLGTRLAEPGVARHLETAGRSKPVPVLPAVGIFGANASGKTAILRAIDDMRSLVVESFRSGHRGTPMDRSPFLLDAVSRRRPSRFEIDLILDGVRWSYAFEVDDECVLSELATYEPRGRRALAFHRVGDSVEFGSPFRATGRALRRLLRHNSLLLSLMGAVDDVAFSPLFAWFAENLWLADSNSRDVRATFTARLVNDDESKVRVLELLRAADLGISDIHLTSVDPDVRERLELAWRILHSLESESLDDERFLLPDLVELSHLGHDGSVRIDYSDESEGTMVWVGLIGPVLQVLDRGGVLLADELDASLHPHLVEQLVMMFQSRDTNPKHAQLIFNSHDTNLMGDSGRRSIGRDQIWYSEKRSAGQSQLIPHSDYRTRRDEAIQNGYLFGRYGGVPFLDRMDYVNAARSLETTGP